MSSSQKQKIENLARRGLTYREICEKLPRCRAGYIATCLSHLRAEGVLPPAKRRVIMGGKAARPAGEVMGSADAAGAPPAQPSRLGHALVPGDPIFLQAVALVREARLNRGGKAAMALWQALGLPWVPEFEAAPLIALQPTDCPVRLFALEMIVSAPGCRTIASNFWPAFAGFCNARSIPNPGKGVFFTRFGRLGYTKERRSRVTYLGIRPRDITVAETAE